jgi:hypothetical protein
MNPVEELQPIARHRDAIFAFLRDLPLPFASMAGTIIANRSEWVAPVDLPQQDRERDFLRSSLLLWACEAFGGDPEAAVPVAAAVELFHRATLLHDELREWIDAPPAQSAIVRWGVGQALNAGDAMSALAFELLVRDVSDAPRRLQVATLIAGAVMNTIESRTAARPTGALVAAAMESGAILGGASEAARRAFYRAGRALGIALDLRTSIDPAQRERAQRLTQKALVVVRHYAVNDAPLSAFESITQYVAARPHR